MNTNSFKPILLLLLVVVYFLDGPVLVAQQLEDEASSCFDQDRVFERFGAANKGSNTRFLLPRQYRLKDRFLVTKFILTQDRSQGENNKSGKVSMGGSLEFEVSGAFSEQALTEKDEHAKLIWKAISCSTAPAAAGSKSTQIVFIFPQPGAVETELRIPLSTSEYDQLWNDPNEPLNFENWIAPAIRVYFVVTDYVDLGATQKRVSLSPADWQRAIESWNSMHASLNAIKSLQETQAGNSTIAFRNEAAVIAFMSHLLDRLAQDNPSANWAELNDHERLALFAKIADQWLVYGLQSDKELGGQMVFSVGLGQQDLASKVPVDFDLGVREKIHRLRSFDVHCKMSTLNTQELKLHGFEHEIDQRIKFVPFGNWEQLELESVGVELELHDPGSGYSRKARILLPVDRPKSWRGKGRFLEGQRLKWRIIFARTNAGKIVRPPKALPWNSRKANIYYDFRFVDASVVKEWVVKK